MRGLKNSITVNLLLLLAGGLVGLVLLEGLLRIYNPFGFRVKSNKIILPANEDYSIKNNRVPKLDRIIVHKKNALGFRGKPFPPDPEKHYKIITVGGSTTECFYLSDGKTWPDRLAARLEKDYPCLWLNNAGLDGHSTFGHIVLMQDYVVKLKPDMVIFLVGFNDIGRGDLGEYDKHEVMHGMEEGNIRALITYAAQYSEVVSSVLNFRRYLMSQEMADRYLKKVRRQENVSQPGEGAADQKEIELHRQRYLPPYAARLTRLVAICKENGLEPVLMTQPEVADDPLLEIYNEVTRKVGGRENILVIDLARQMPREPRYYYDYGHYTNAGADKVAEIIYQELSPFIGTKYQCRP